VIISKQLSIYVQQAQKPKEGEAPTFHMTSYLLDVIYTKHLIASMNLIWHVVELPVHIYFSILKEEVVQRMANPNMTRFKAMRMNKQVETIERLAQEALRVQEEIRAAETTKAQRR
jgi:hypothetical protein